MMMNKERRRIGCSKCENYLTATTSRSRNLIRLRSTRRSPILEVQFRIPSRGPEVYVLYIIARGISEGEEGSNRSEKKMRKKRFNEKLQT